MHTTKMLCTIAITAIVIALFGACGSSGGPSIDASTSGLGVCVKPGDIGNALGVGKYCDTITECSGLTAGVCATLGEPDAHFCTKPCPQGSTDACGTAATCACQGSQCGCVPDVCLH